MSRKGIIEVEHHQQCDLCGEIAELRPYGPDGEKVCFDCGMKDPEAVERGFRRHVLGETPAEPPPDECSSCGDPDCPVGECPKSERPCGHHCNHSWSHDHCDWCGAEWGEGGEVTPSAPSGDTP